MNYSIDGQKSNGKYIQPSRKNLRILRKAFPEIHFWKHTIHNDFLPNEYTIKCSLEYNDAIHNGMAQTIDTFVKTYM